MGVLSEMDTLLTELFEFAFLPSQPLVPLFPFCSTTETFGYHCKEQCMLGSHVGCCVSVGQQRRGGSTGYVVALGPCCLSSLLGAFRTFWVCSGGYCRFIKPQWLKRNAKQEQGRDWTWTLFSSRQMPNQGSFRRDLIPAIPLSVPLLSYDTRVSV